MPADRKHAARSLAVLVLALIGIVAVSVLAQVYAPYVGARLFTLF